MMDTDKNPVNMELVAFSDETINESYSKVVSFINSKGRDFNLRELVSNVDPNLLTILSKMIDIVAENEIFSDTTNDEIDELNERLNKDIKDWSIHQKEILTITFIDKILNNMRFVSKNITEEHIRDTIYLHNFASDISFIWFLSYRERLKRQI